MPSRGGSRFPLLWALLLASAAHPGRGQTGTTGALAITGVTVIDPSSTARLLTQRTILIVDGRIRAVGPAARVRIPRGARVVRAMGKYAIPGLWDMHVHFMNTGSSALPLLVAHGVTSVREMGGFLDSTRAWQARMAAGTLVGPRIITPGPILESPQYLDGVRRRDAALGGRLAPRVLPYRVGVATPDDARAVIEMLVRQRVDFAKIRTAASPEAYFAILREARRAGLPVAGHAPGVASLVEASDSGQKSIEHAFAPPLNRLTSGERDALYVNLARKGTWYTPTLVVSRAVGVAGDSAERAIFGDSASRLDPRRPYASRWLLGWWRMQVDERLADTSSTRGAALRDAYESSLEDVRRMHVAGVRILAGTDAGSVLVYPGFSLHEELRLLVEGARLRPRDALWSATMGPARYLGLERSTGSIAAGKVADIVLLDRNPLANIRNTTRIFAVVKGGRVFTRSQLDALLAEVRVAAGS